MEDTHGGEGTEMRVYDLVAQTSGFSVCHGCRSSWDRRLVFKFNSLLFIHLHEIIQILTLILLSEVQPVLR